MYSRPNESLGLHRDSGKTVEGHGRRNGEGKERNPLDVLVKVAPGNGREHLHVLDRASNIVVGDLERVRLGVDLNRLARCLSRSLGCGGHGNVGRVAVEVIRWVSTPECGRRRFSPLGGFRKKWSGRRARRQVAARRSGRVGKEELREYKVGMNCSERWSSCFYAGIS